MTDDNMTGIGYLVVRVTTAGGAIPLADALVTVSGNTEEQSEPIATMHTDRDGLTRKIPLPTPPASMSGQPNMGQAYATYNISVTMPGYYGNTYQNVPIFDHVTAIQSMSLIPLSRNEYEDNFTPNDTRFYESENQSL